MKTCLIDQSCGLGDILMTIKIGCNYASKGYKVIWPVEPVYKNLQRRITTIENIEFPCIHDVYDLKMKYEKLSRTNLCNVTETDSVLYVPIRKGLKSNFGIDLRRSCSHEASNVLSKFGMCGLTYDAWQNYFYFNRDSERENKIFKHLNLEDGDKIHIVNNKFGTPPRWNETLKTNIVTPTSLKRIEMRMIEGFDLFDWIGLLEKAVKIDTVATSLVFMFENINLSCSPTIYSRNKSSTSALEDFSLMKKIYNKQYHYKE